MDIKNKPTLAEKQVFWAEQIPNFEAKYWLPDHFSFLVFDMDQGNYVIKDDLDPIYEDDANEIYHRVNTGWAMWKKAITFAKAQVSESNVMDFDEWFKKRHEKTSLYEEALCGKDDATYIKHEMNKAFQAGRKEKQAMHEGFVLVPKELSDEKADDQAMFAWGFNLKLFKSENRYMTAIQVEEFRLRWCLNKARALQQEYSLMIQAQEQSHE